MGSCGSEGQSNLSKLSNSCQFLEKVPITQEPMPGWGEVMHLKKSEGGSEWEERPISLALCISCAPGRLLSFQI